ncbi:unnamed protein product [Plutella xylostella]|uniref:(diamondback moth) hypothetical protein n=1 Tax=Plutella xylostella TaxID=51655 RepID=A0A8S4G7A2_PLUXY|nr:unnamed protein product [Plutella xylostella]
MDDRTIRRFLEQNKQPHLVILATECGSDAALLTSLAPLYFPRSDRDADAARWRLVDDAQPERRIRIIHNPTHLQANCGAACGAASGAASGERRKQTLDNVRSMPQLAAARNAARLAARVACRGARRRRAARCASETNVLESIEAATAQSGARGGIKWTD